MHIVWLVKTSAPNSLVNGSSQRSHAATQGRERVLMLTSLSPQGLCYRRIDRHLGMTVQSQALRLVVKQVDWEGQCFQHQTFG
jgi:hypothetical protein